MYCKNCGNIMDDGDKFCKSCGATVPQQDQQQAQQNYGFQQNNYQQPQYNYQQPQYNYQQAQGYDYQQAHYANQAPGYGYGYAQPRPGVGFGDAIKLYFNNFTNFSGRARRSEYWFAYLFVWIVNMVCAYIPVVNIIVPLVLIVGNLAVGVRRLHDAGKSGWYYLCLLLPLAGAIVVHIALCSDSEGHNQYGPSPKY